MKSIKSQISFRLMEGGSFSLSNTSSYSIIKGTDIAVENLLPGKKEANLYEAPLLEFNAVKRTFASMTIFIMVLYIIPNKSGQVCFYNRNRPSRRTGLPRYAQLILKKTREMKLSNTGRSTLLVNGMTSALFRVTILIFKGIGISKTYPCLLSIL